MKELQRVGKECTRKIGVTNEVNTKKALHTQKSCENEWLDPRNWPYKIN